MRKKPLSTCQNRLATASLVTLLTLAAAPVPGEAAGLGRISVLSSLGQPLRAEVELSATPQELSGLTARIAPPDQHQAAGIEFSPALLGIRFNIDQRPDGKAIIRLLSERPITEPFINMLVEINWSNGRLVREYTFLLDPPPPAASKPGPVVEAPRESKAQDSQNISQAKPKGQAPASKTAASAVTTAEPPQAAAKTPASKPAPVAASPAAAPATPSSAAQPKSESESEYEVAKGDTLRKIAAAHAAEGISLEQMLTGLFRANPEAFDGANMNRLRAGKILAIPDRQALERIPQEEARQIVVAQSRNWNDYRARLAGAATRLPVSQENDGQSASGKITARIEERGPTAAPTDQVKLSRSEAASKKRGAADGPTAEDLIARERAIKEANERVEKLEKNVNELQKLLDMKNQALSVLQQQASSKVEEPAQPAAAPAPAPQTSGTPATAENKVPADTAPAAPPAAGAAPATPTAPATPPPVKSAEDAPPQPKPKPLPPPPAPLPEPSLVDTLLEDPLLLAGGGSIAALLLGYAVYRRRRQQAGDAIPLSESNSTLTQNSLTANSVFRNTGGQSVDTSQTPAHTDFSQTGPGTIDTDEVDPVAEADVYMAYGRDAQAEEILLEAKQKDPQRHAIHLKLLEIYANRKSVKQFETLATELYGDNGGQGSDWEKAAAMGRKLDPENPLYGGSPAPSFDADATVIVPAAQLKETVILSPGKLEQAAAGAAALGVAAGVAAASPGTTSGHPSLSTATAPPSDEMMDLDFDLGWAAEEPGSPGAPSTPTSPASPPATAAAAPEVPPPATAPTPARTDDAGLDFDLGDFDLGLEEPASATNAANAAAPAALADADGLDFDFGINEPPAQPAPPAPATEPPTEPPAEPPLAAEADESMLDFDLGTEAETPSTTSTAAVAEAAAWKATEAIEFTGLDDLTEAETEAEVENAPSPAAPTAGEAKEEALDFDLDALTMDFDLPESSAAPEAPEAPSTATLAPLPDDDFAAMFDALPEPGEVKANPKADEGPLASPQAMPPSATDNAFTETVVFDAEALEALDSPADIEDKEDKGGFDLSALNLDLGDAPGTPPPPAAQVAGDAPPVLDENWDLDDLASLDQLSDLSDLSDLDDLSKLGDLASPLPDASGAAEPAPEADVTVEDIDFPLPDNLPELHEMAGTPPGLSPAPDAVNWPESLELATEDAAAVAADADAADSAAEEIAPDEEVQTKFALATAYEEMGDLEGAIELLQEILGEGSTPQQQQARETLTRLGA